MENLIGKTIRGFKFEGNWNTLYIDHLMDRFIREEGQIELVDEGETSALVYFDDNNLYWYPLDQVYNHLVEEKPLKRYTGICSSCKKEFGTDNKRCNLCDECAETIVPFVTGKPILGQEKVTPLDQFFKYLEQNQYYIDDKLVAEYNRLKDVH